MISLNIFAKCPNTGNPKQRMGELLDKKGRSDLAKIMLINILEEMHNINISLKTNLWVYPNIDNEWIKKAIEHNNLWSKKIFSILEENKITTNKPSANFFLMNFSKTKINSEEAFEKLSKERLILRKMEQYKIPNSLRLTIGNEQENIHFIKSIKEICK